MNDINFSSPLERNFSRLLKSSAAAATHEFEEHVLRVVLAEVCRERSLRSRPFWDTRTAYWSVALAAAAATLFVVLALRSLPCAASSYVGTVKVVYGLAALQQDDVSVDLGQDVPATMEEWKKVPSGAWVSTRWGSQAEVLLTDHSRLLLQPHTVFRVEGGRDGKKITLNQGEINIEAAKQLSHETLQIETPGARIAIRGTKLDVYVVQKPDGRKQTRVSVVAGHVELESGGKAILLPANTEGVADEGRPPERRCLTAEINELHRLQAWNERLARQAGLQSGLPAIVEFQGDATAKVWLVVPRRYLSQTGRQTKVLQLTEGAAEFEAFTLEGSPLAVVQSDRALKIQSPDAVGESAENEQVILKLGGVKGMFTALGKGVFEFAYAEEAPAVLSLIQFRLPQSAEIAEIRPAPVEDRRGACRQFLTVAAHIRGLGIVSSDD